MGGPYNIPRNYKGESKILFIFSMKSFIYTVVGVGIGLVFYLILKPFNLAKIGAIIAILLGLIGFVIGTFKIPENLGNPFLKKVGGEQIDDIIKRWFLFKKKKNRIYVYKEESKDE